MEQLLCTHVVWKGKVQFLERNWCGSNYIVQGEFKEIRYDK